MKYCQKYIKLFGIEQGTYRLPVDSVTSGRDTELFFHIRTHMQVCMHAGCVVHTLPMVSTHTTDLRVAFTYQEMQKCSNKGREEEDCKIVNMDVNNAG